MVTEAAAGRYRGLEGFDLPRIQIYTIEDNWNGIRPEFPPTLADTRLRAPREAGEQQELI